MKFYNMAFLLSLSKFQNKVVSVILASQVVCIELNEEKYFIYNAILVNLMKQSIPL